jgi:hypothetical protein
MSLAAPLQAAPAKPEAALASAARGVLQRKCACGSSKSSSEGRAEGRDDESPSPLLQRKLAIGATSDPLEREADRVADQVLAAPLHAAVGGTPPRIQRFTGQPIGQMNAVPASVDQALAGPGRPLEPTLRQDMESRFGHDFSRVRVHSGAPAEQSAQDVEASAYTVGYNIVFGAGQFQPGSSIGRGLLAHELTHVVQQSTASDVFPHNRSTYSSPSGGRQHGAIAEGAVANMPLLQRKKRPEKTLSIVKIVAFEGRLEDAEAHLSDRSVERVTLTKNSLAAGNYLYQLDRSEPTLYRLKDHLGEHGAFLWKPGSIFSGESQHAEVVAVQIIGTTPEGLDNEIAKLQPATRRFLTTDKPGGGKPTIADKAAVLKAGTILEEAGVTEDEFLLLEQQQSDAPGPGESLEEGDSPVAWARVFIAERLESGKKALTNRQELLDIIRQINAIRDERNAPWRRDIKNTAEGVFTEETVSSALIHNNIIYRMFTDRFEVELKAITQSFLSQALVALLRIEKLYLADKNVGIEKRRLNEVFEKIRPALKRRDEAADKLAARTGRATGYGVLPKAVAPAIDPRVTTDTEVLTQKETELEEQARSAGFGIRSLHGFDLDLIRRNDIEKSRNELRQFVAVSRSRLTSAQQKAQSIKTLYGADRMIELTKAALGVQPGSVTDDVIRARVRAQTADHSFWSLIWDIATLALMFVPGNIGVALRVGAGLVNATKAVDEYVEGKSVHNAGFTSQAPSSLGVFLAVGGSLIDAQQIAKGVFKVIDTEASLGAKAAAKTSAAVSEAKQPVKTVAADVAETKVGQGAATKGEEALAPRVAGEVSTGAKAAPVPVPKGVNDETAEMLTKRRPDLAEALAKNPRAAKALTLCESLCIPEFATPAQVKHIESLMADAEKRGLKIEMDRVKKAFHKSKDEAELSKAIGDFERSIDYRPKKVSLPTPILSERDAGTVVNNHFPAPDWEYHPLHLQGRPAGKIRGRNPLGSSEPEYYSKSLNTAVEVKTKDFVARLESVDWNAMTRQLEQRIHAMPPGTKNWIMFDIRGQPLSVAEISIFPKLSAKWDEVFFLTDKGMSKIVGGKAIPVP